MVKNAGVLSDRTALSDRIELATSALRVELAPAVGGGIARFDWLCGGRPGPLFRAAGAGPLADPDALACFPLLPFSNRIGAGRFEFDGRTVKIAPNRKGERYPLHGTGWQRAWRVEQASAARATLSLDENGQPYAYRATQEIELVDTTLTIRMRVENRGDVALPFGLGLHPFIARGSDTLLVAPAQNVWLSGRDWLPTRRVRVPAAYRFGIAYPLPRHAVVNHAFTDWEGQARVIWPEHGLALEIEADVRDYVLYTPAGADWFCFEPVDHPIDAVNLPGGAVRHGMTSLAPGEDLTRTFRFKVDLFGALPTWQPRSH